MKASIYQDPCFADIRLTLWEERNGKLYVAQPVELIFEECSEGYSEPTMKLGHFMSKQFLQALCDEIARHGITPTGKPPLENELTAIKYHLEDMRSLVFK